jgi:hypothetical protein
MDTIREHIDCLRDPELDVTIYIYVNHLYIGIGHNHVGCSQWTKLMYIKERGEETEEIVTLFPSFYCEFWIWRTTGRQYTKEGIFVGKDNEFYAGANYSEKRPWMPLHNHLLVHERHANYTCLVCLFRDNGDEYDWHTCRQCNYGECLDCYKESSRLEDLGSILDFPPHKSRIDFKSAGKAVDFSSEYDQSAKIDDLELFIQDHGKECIYPNFGGIETHNPFISDPSFQHDCLIED